MPFMSSPSEMPSSLPDTHLEPNPSDLPDITATLNLDSKRIVASNLLSVVYRCLDEQCTKVAVKAIAFPPYFDPPKKDEFKRKARREIGLLRRLEHPNIVPLLGKASGEKFGSDLPCLVSRWMPNGTLDEYVKHGGTIISLCGRIQLITRLATGLEYLHSKGIVHGDLHPANVLIDDNHNPRLTDLGLSHVLRPLPDQLAYLHTNSARPGAVLWAAPELLFPDLYPNLESRATPYSDIYSLGSIILLILSGQPPWKERGEAENKLKKFQNPPRPTWPVNMPDAVWHFIERCWSPQDPSSRPSAREIITFCTNELEQLLRPNPSSDINVILFGASGSGKSSIINLLTGEPIAPESPDTEPCTRRPRSYHIFIDGRRVLLWDTVGFTLAHETPAHDLSPYEHAHAVLRNLSEGANLILFCANRGKIGSSSPSLGCFHRFINYFFQHGRAPIAFVVTNSDTPDEAWWKRNEHSIAQRTNIPTQFIPHACITTDPAGSDRSKHTLKELLRTYAIAVPPVPLRPDLSSRPPTLSDLTAHCKLSIPDAKGLVEKFGRPLRPFNVVFCGDIGTGSTSIISLITRRAVVETVPRVGSRSHRIHTGMSEFRVWDLHEAHIGQDAYAQGSKNAQQLIENSSGEGGIDLLVFCKRFGELTRTKLNTDKLFEDTLRKRQCPVAFIVTHFESQYSAEKWWEMDGKELAKAIGGDVIGHACIPPLARYDPGDRKFDKSRVKSRVLIEEMLEDCVSSHLTRLTRTRRKEIREKFSLNIPIPNRKSMARQRYMTVWNHEDCHRSIRE